MVLIPTSFSFNKMSLISFSLITLNINFDKSNFTKLNNIIEFALISGALVALNFTELSHFDAGWTPERECDGGGSLLLFQIFGGILGFFSIKIFNFFIRDPRVWIKYAILIILADGLFFLYTQGTLRENFEIQKASLTSKSWDADTNQLVRIVVPKNYPREYKEKAKAQSVKTSILMSEENKIDSLKSCHILELYFKMLCLMIGLEIAIAVVIFI